ncbi:MAG: HPr(Ser) kinase/phosphatase [Burkholderiales bacterium]|jgi:HPr kinase/phosphorylase|nr:HPr(Ser) kinase/phosphatase [Burkholderiales bacterium]
MSRTVTIEQLFKDNRTILRLEWVAGKSGGDRELAADKIPLPTTSLIGHLNLIHTFHIQVFGIAETAYLFSLPENQRVHFVEKLFAHENLSAIVLCNSPEALPILTEHCDLRRIPLMVSKHHSPYVVDVLRLYLLRTLAETVSVHGVLLDVLEMGVLITGESAIGKSELALELITRGNALVADDMVELHRISPDTLEGRCPAMLSDFLEVRGIGILNIRTMFGETAIRPRKLLRLIVHLEKCSETSFAQIERLPNENTYETLLDVPIRKVTIPVAAGRNLAVLVEAAVRNFMLSQRGIDSTQEFILRQREYMTQTQEKP